MRKSCSQKHVQLMQVFTKLKSETWQTKDMWSLYPDNVRNVANISVRLSNKIPQGRYLAKDQIKKDLLLRITRYCVSYTRYWFRQNNLSFENIAIDESRVNDLPVHGDNVIKIHPTDNSKSTAYDINPNKETNDEETKGYFF